MALPNVAYSVQSLPTLGKNIVVASSGTFFGTVTRARQYVIAPSFWRTVTRGRTYQISLDGYLVVSLPTLGKNAVIRTSGTSWRVDGQAGLSWSPALGISASFEVDGHATVAFTGTGGALPPSFEIDGLASLDFQAVATGGPLNFTINGQASLIFWAQKAGTGVCGTPLPGGPGGDPGGGSGTGGGARNYVF